MPARAMWKAVVSFGGISVPVKLYAAVREQRVQFRLLHDQDKAPLRQQMVCPKDDEVVEREHMVKAYEVDENRYVIVDPQELESLEPESSRVIEVLEFAPQPEVDPRYYDHPYYLGPDGDETRFATLRQALSEIKEVGICQWVMRRNSYIGLLGLADGALSLVTMHYAEDVLPPESLELKKGKLDPRELKMAKYLVETMAGEFHPEQYRNEHQQRLREMLERKARGQKVAAARPTRTPATKSSALLGALEASVKRAQDRKKQHAEVVS